MQKQIAFQQTATDLQLSAITDRFHVVANLTPLSHRPTAEALCLTEMAVIWVVLGFPTTVPSPTVARWPDRATFCALHNVQPR